jgi:phage-related tail fiber protein
MALLVKNPSNTDAVTVGDLGFTVQASGTYNLLAEGFDRLRTSSTLVGHLTAGTLKIIRKTSPETFWTADEAVAYVLTGVSPSPDLVGLSALGVPRGTTGQRPGEDDATEGLLRFNTDLKLLEGFVDDGWQQLVYSDDHRLNPHNEVHVHQEPGEGQFSSVAAAVDAITDASATNRYLIHVGAGVFTESQIILKPYIALQGMGRDVTVIRAVNPNQHLMLATENVEISGMMLDGASGIADADTGTGSAAIRVTSTQTVSGSGVFIDSVRFGYNHTHVLIDQPTGTTGIAYVNNCVFGGTNAFVQGFLAQGAGTARVQVRNSTTVGTTAPHPTVIFKADGPLCQVLVIGCLLRSGSIPDSTAVHLRNGGGSRIMGLSIVNFGKGFWCENVGSAPVLNAVGINMEANLQDLVIEHPGTSGNYNGSGTRSKVVINPAAPLSVFYTDPVNKGTTTVGPLFLGNTHTDAVDVTDLLLETPTMGLLEGGDLTRGTGRTIQVEAGFGYVTTVQAKVVRVSWADQDVVITANRLYYVYIDSTGTVKTASSLPDNTATILLGWVATDTTDILTLANLQSTAHHTANHLDNFNRVALGPIYVSGSIVSENGTTPGALNITAGRYFYSTKQYLPSGGTAVSLDALPHVAGVRTPTAMATVPLGHYDNMTELVPLAAGTFTKHSLYVVGDGTEESYVLIPGQTQFATQIEAEEGLLPIPPRLPDNVAMIAAIIVQQGQPNIMVIQDARPVIGFKATGISASAVHGNLLGLEEDDHPQYVRVDGTRPMISPLDMGAENIINAGTINGVTIADHASRHLPNGADPLATAAPASGLTASSTNAVGIANSLARSDHSHAITGFQVEDADLTSLAALTGTGVVVRTGDGTHETRTLTGSTGRIAVTNGSGAAGNPTVDLATTGIAPGTYNSLTVDSYGRITAGTFESYGTGGGDGGDGGSSGPISLTGDVTGTGTGAVSTTLSPTGVEAGTYSSVTVDAKGRVTAASNPTTLSGYGITDAQGLDADLTALAGLTTTGLIARTAGGTATTRSLTAPAAGLTISNPDGVSGSPTFGLSDDLAALEGLSGTGFAVRTAADTWANRSISGTDGRIGVANGNGISGGPVIDLVTTGVSTGTYNTLTVDTFGRVTAASNTAYLTGNQPIALSGDITGSGATVINATLSPSGVSGGTYRSVTVDTKGRVTAGSNPTTLGGYGITDAQPLDADLTALAGLTSTGLVIRTGDGTAATRTLTGPNAGVTVTNGDGVSGNPTLALANDLAAVEGLTTTGIAVRTGTDTWTTRTLSGQTGRITVTNGTATAGNPVIDLTTTGVTSGTFAGLTVDSYGRITAASPLTSLTEYGITDAVQNAGTTPSIASGLLSARPSAATPGRLFVTTDTLGLYRDSGTAWSLIAPAITGDVAVAAGGTAATLATTGVGAGTYRSVSVDTKGRVTAGTNPTTLAGYAITDAQPLDADLTALAGLTTTGFAVRTGTDTWAARSIAGTTGQTTITNGTGAAGNVTVALASDPVLPGTGSATLPVGTTAQRPAAPTNGMSRYNSTLGTTEFYQNGSWVSVTTNALRSYLFYSEMFVNPTNADWAVNSLAPATVDPLRTSFTIRSFDDTTEEGVGFMLTIPSGITNLTLNFKSRPASAPTSTANNGVVLRLFSRAIPDEAAVGAWNAGSTLSTIPLTVGSSFYQYDAINLSLTTLGLTAGVLYNFQLTRQAGAAADTLAGDWYLVEMIAEFS